MKKLYLALLLALLSANSLLSNDIEPMYFEIDGVSYMTTTSIYDQFPTVEAIGTSTYEGTVVIPDFVIYEGIFFDVSGIGAWAFYGYRSLESIVVPPMVHWIGEEAFSGCSNLKSLKLPVFLTDIRNKTFYSCTSLESLEIPELVISIGAQAFSSCHSLTSITCYAENPPTLGEGAFSSVPNDIPLYVPLNSVPLYQHADQWKDFNIFGIIDFNFFELDGIAYKITSSEEPYTVEVTSKTPSYEGDLVIPGHVIYGGISWSVTGIGEGAFDSSPGLLSIEIPNSVSDIAKDVFEGCSGLTSIDVVFENEHYSSTNGVLYNKEKSLLIKYPPDKEGVSFTFPISVTDIGERAFGDNTTLKSIVSYAENPPNLGLDVFESVTKDFTLYVQESSIALYQKADQWENFNVIGLSSNLLIFDDKGIAYKITSSEAPYTVEVTEKTPHYEGAIVIPNEVFYGGIAYSVANIGVDAFSFCTKLISIEIPNSITNIGDRAFSRCNSLKSIEIPNSVTDIGDRAFYSCGELTSVKIPNSVINMGSWAFAECRKLISIEIPNSVTNIGDCTFWLCSGLTSIGIPNSVTNIGNYAFNYCTGLTSIEIPNSVINIGNYAFTQCAGLRSIVIPNSVISIGDYAFSYCTELTSIEIPNSVTNIGIDAFNSCRALTSIKIPNSVTRISAGSFYECINLTSIEIPNSVTDIGSSAFSNCIKLQSIEIPNSVTTIGSDAFFGCTGLTGIEIPNSVTNLWGSAFNLCSNLTFINIDVENEHFTSENGIAYNKDMTLFVRYPQSKAGNNYKIANSVTTIGHDAFNRCEDLISIEIPTNVTNISSSAFMWCKGLTSIEIPNSVSEIGGMAFWGCMGLTSITCNSEYPPDLGGSVFYSVPKYIPLYIPESSVALYQQADQWKDFNIVGITVEENFEVDDMGYKITSAEAPYSVEVTSKTLDYEGDVVIPEQVIYEGISYLVTSIGNNAFSSSNGLKSIEGPQMVSKNSNGVFDLNTSLTSIEIPKSVTNIGDGAFENCSSLTSITCFADNPPVLGFSVFENVPKDIPLYVPESSVDLYQLADQWKEFNVIGASNYSIIYNANGGTGEMESQVYGFGQSVSLNLNTFSKSGYLFAGWNTHEQGDGIFYDDDEIVLMNGDLTLFAQWRVVNYSIAYYLNGGTNPDNNPASFTIDDLKLTLEVPEKAGYIFSGWFTDGSFINEVTEITATGNIELWAKFEIANYSITYHLNGGTNPINNPASYTIDDLKLALEVSEKEGYLFSGWFTDGSFINEVTEITATGDIELWARFDIITNINTSGILNNIEIFPNPVSDFLNIGLGEYNGEVNFEIFNASGQSVLSGNASGMKTLNTSSLEPGIFIIVLTGDGWVETKRFIKK